jgi:REP element-mobilizing transposase RayT
MPHGIANIIPKYRKKAVFGKIKKNLGAVFHGLARRRECRIEEGHLMPDHVHMLIAIPPKYSVTGFIKGKSSIWIAQERLSAWRQAAKLRLRHCGHLQVRNCGANGF